jgi:hypothetical protein
MGEGNSFMPGMWEWAVMYRCREKTEGRRVQLKRCTMYILL